MRPNTILVLLCALFMDTCSASFYDKPYKPPFQIKEPNFDQYCDAMVWRIANKEATYDPSTKQLACRNKEHALMAIVWKSKRYRALKCDLPRPWRGVDEERRPGSFEETGAAMAEVMRVDCAEYCTVTGTGVERYIEADLKAKCANDGQIYIDNALIDTPRLKCTINGWTKDDNTKITADTETPLQVECKMPCIHGDRPDGVVANVEDGKTVFKCNKPTIDGVKYGISVNGENAYSNFKCDKNGFKDVMDNVVFANAYDAVKLECAIGVPCSCEPAESMVHFDDATRTLSCNSGGDKLMAIEFDSKRYKSLQCDESDGWKDGSTMLADAFTRILVKCLEYCSVITAESGDRTVHFDDTTRTLSCNGGSDKLMAIEFHSKRYKSLQCDDVHGWKDGSTTIAGSFNPIVVKCVEYCAVTGDKIPTTVESGERTASCHENPRQRASAVKDETFDAHMILFVNHKPTAHARSYATCTLEQGWKEYEQSGRSEALTTQTASPARMECRRACVKTTIAAGVKSSPVTNVDSHSIIQFECNKSAETNGDKYGVLINNALVYSKIVCGAAGYTVGDATGHRISSAFEDASFACALLPTTTTSTTTTTTPAPTTTTEPETTTKKVEKFRPRKPLKPTRKDGANSGRKNHDEEENLGWIKQSASGFSIYSMILILVSYGEM